MKTNQTRIIVIPALKSQIWNFLKGGSRAISSNILYSFVIKGVSLVTGFVMVPVTLNYLGTQDYGIWLTLSSVIAWISFFDVGFGNGLRNKLAEAIALNDKTLARTYVSTAYAGLTGLVLLLMLIALAVNTFIDWNSLLIAPAERTYDLNALAVILILLISLRMILKLVSVILIADRRTALGSIFEPLAGILSLTAILILSNYTSQASLDNFILIVSVIPVIVYMIATIIIFKGEYAWLKPDIKLVKREYLGKLTNLGVKFFIIQIAVLVIFSTDNLIITRISGSAAVAQYNIAYKYFSIATMVFTIIMTPMWSSYTQAYTLNNKDWIRKANKRIIFIWMTISVMVILMLVGSQKFYTLWIGDKISIPLLLSILMGVFALISTWNNIFVYFINSTGKITFQLYTSVIAAIVNIPLSIYLAKDFELGPAGVILATCICLFPGVILGPLQFNKILNNTDKGIWSK